MLQWSCETLLESDLLFPKFHSLPMTDCRFASIFPNLEKSQLSTQPSKRTQGNYRLRVVTYLRAQTHVLIWMWIAWVTPFMLRRRVREKGSSTCLHCVCISTQLCPAQPNPFGICVCVRACSCLCLWHNPTSYKTHMSTSNQQSFDGGFLIELSRICTSHPRATPRDATDLRLRLKYTELWFIPPTHSTAVHFQLLRASRMQSF